MVIGRGKCFFRLNHVDTREKKNDCNMQMRFSWWIITGDLFCQPHFDCWIRSKWKIILSSCISWEGQSKFYYSEKKKKKQNKMNAKGKKTQKKSCHISNSPKGRVNQKGNSPKWTLTRLGRVGELKCWGWSSRVSRHDRVPQLNHRRNSSQPSLRKKN